jgi:molybdopterin-guanine dinucleotide biosynthesis protein A
VAAIVACDMPFVNVALLAAQQALLVDENVDTVLPGLEHGYEPFHAVYTVQKPACLRFDVRLMLANGERSPGCLM